MDISVSHRQWNRIGGYTISRKMSLILVEKCCLVKVLQRANRQRNSPIHLRFSGDAALLMLHPRDAASAVAVATHAI